MPAIGQAVASYTQSTAVQNSGIPTAGDSNRPITATDIKISGKSHDVSTSPANEDQILFAKALHAKQVREHQKEMVKKATTHNISDTKKTIFTPFSSDSTGSFSTTIPQSTNTNGEDVTSASKQTSSLTSTSTSITKTALVGTALLSFGLQGLQGQDLWPQPKPKPKPKPDTSDAALTPKAIDLMIDSIKKEPEYKATNADIRITKDWIKKSATKATTLNDNAAWIQDIDSNPKTTQSSGSTTSSKAVDHSMLQRNKRDINNKLSEVSRFIDHLDKYGNLDSHLTVKDYRYITFSGTWPMRRIHNRFKVSITIKTNDYQNPNGRIFTIPPGSYEDIFYNRNEDKPYFSDMKFKLSYKEVPVIRGKQSYWEHYDYEHNVSTYKQGTVTISKSDLIKNINMYRDSNKEPRNIESILNEYVIQTWDKNGREAFMEIDQVMFFEDSNTYYFVLKNSYGKYQADINMKMIPKQLVPEDAIWK